MQDTWILFIKVNNDRIFIQEGQNGLHSARDMVWDVVKNDLDYQPHAQLKGHIDNIYVLYRGVEFKLNFTDLESD